MRSPKKRLRPVRPSHKRVRGITGPGRRRCGAWIYEGARTCRWCAPELKAAQSMSTVCVDLAPACSHKQMETPLELIWRQIMCNLKRRQRQSDLCNVVTARALRRSPSPGLRRTVHPPGLLRVPILLPHVCGGSIVLSSIKYSSVREYGDGAHVHVDMFPRRRSVPCAALLWALGLLGCSLVMHRRGLV
jgi:hypothetical protein